MQIVRIRYNDADGRVYIALQMHDRPNEPLYKDGYWRLIGSAGPKYAERYANAFLARFMLYSDHAKRPVSVQHAIAYAKRDYLKAVNEVASEPDVNAMGIAEGSWTDEMP